MPGCFRFEEQFFWVSSQRFEGLLVHGAAVGLKTAANDQERAWANGLRDRIPDLCARNELNIETDIPSGDERFFWARVFDDLAYLMFRREVAADDPGFQNCTSVADAWVLGRMMWRSVPWEEMKNWNLNTMAIAELQDMNKKSKDSGSDVIFV